MGTDCNLNYNFQDLQCQQQQASAKLPLVTDLISSGRIRFEARFGAPVRGLISPPDGAGQSGGLRSSVECRETETHVCA